MGWGGTYGAIKEAVIKARALGMNVSQAHLQYLNPFPKNTGQVLRSFKKIIVPEINLGQLTKLLRSEYLVEIIQFNVVRGLPFRVSDILDKIQETLGGKNGK